jgi:8-oxo-dGTP pyrophosphatase MutT (NUDIX family)
VAAVFRPGPSETELLFIQRASFDGDPWSGQMAFPGGRVEPSDPDTAATAERETNEELGLDLHPVRRLGNLAEVDGGRATNRPMQVAGHCYWLDGPRPDLTPNYEVADVVWVSLSQLLDETRYIDYWYREAPTPFPGIQLNRPDQVIWGLTLRFLADLFRRLERPFII